MIVSRKQEKDIHLENLLSSRTMNSLLMPSIAFSGHDLCCIRGERMVFAHLSFSLHPGDALVLLGANGSGKSSLLRLMAGLLPPAYGTLRWHDAKTTEEIRPHYVGHAEALKPMLTVAENLGFWTRIGGAPSDAVIPALERFGMSSLHDLPARFLSAGQKRRLSLARLLAIPSPLWLLDEPSVGLDRASVSVLETVIAEHRSKGGMVAVSTHADFCLPEHRNLHLETYIPREDEEEDA